jgi:hypothetical protein
VYSYGILLWEMVHQSRNPYRATCGPDAAPWTIMGHVSQGGRPQFTARLVPGAYVALAQACWSQDAQDRPSFGEIVDRLEWELGSPGGGVHGEHGGLNWVEDF